MNNFYGTQKATASTSLAKITNNLHGQQKATKLSSLVKSLNNNNSYNNKESIINEKEFKKQVREDTINNKHVQNVIKKLAKI